jgi:hypothetical protein
VGASSEGRPVDLLTIGHGSRAVLLVGVPHPNEPIGTLTLEFLCRLLCEDEALRASLDVTFHVIQVADPDGFVLNEGWFKGAFSPLRYALEYYRPPHREQVEWSFPVDYKTLRFTTPSAETAAVMRVMQRVRPRVFYSLHNAGFCGVYFYVSHDRPALFAALRGLVESQALPLHRGEPEVPYLRTLAPAVYALFGIDETYDYMARTLGEDPAPLIEAGTSSDDWLSASAALLARLRAAVLQRQRSTTRDPRAPAGGTRSAGSRAPRRSMRRRRAASRRSPAALPTIASRARWSTTCGRPRSVSPPSVPTRRSPRTPGSRRGRRRWTRRPAGRSTTCSISARCTGSPG